jgi:hypothetical protein
VRKLISTFAFFKCNLYRYIVLSGRNRAIVVGNAQPVLMDWARVEISKEDGDRLYIAERKEARGILEGLEKFGFLVK